MRTRRFVRLGTAALIWLVFALVVTWGAAHADGPPVSSDPSQLEISAQTGGAWGTTFYLSTTDTVAGLRVIANELRPVADGRGVTLPSIQPTQITVQSTNQITQIVAGQGRERWSIEITDIPSEHGTWSGDLVVEWTDPQYGFLAIPLTVKSISKPALAVHDPAKIVIMGQRGQSLNPRTVTLHETVGGSDASGLDVIVPDLQNEDQTAVLPASHIVPGIPNSASPNSYPQVTVDVNLDGVSAGSYSGKLLITSTNADDLPVDIEVKVKHPLLGPAIALLVGLIITIGFGEYRSFGQRRDKVLTGFRRLETFMRQYGEFKKVFGPAVETASRDADEAIRDRKAQDAEAALQQAETFRDRWVLEGAKYTRIVEDIEKNLVKIAELLPEWSNTEFMTALCEHLKSIKAELVPNYPDASKMFDDKHRTYKAIGGYCKAKRTLQDLRQRWKRAELEKGDRDGIKAKLDTYENTLRDVEKHRPNILDDVAEGVKLPTNLNLETLNGNLGTVEEELEEAIEKAQGFVLRYTACEREAEDLLSKIKAGPVKDAFRDTLTEATNRLRRCDLAGAATYAQNAWWAAVHEARLFSVARRLTGDAEKEFKKVSGTLDAFLRDRHNYGHSPGDDNEAADTYRGEMRSYREKVLAIVLTVPAHANFKFETGPIPTASPPDKAPRRGEEEPYVHSEDEPPPSQEERWFESFWKRLAGTRLRLFTVATWVVAIFILYLTAWQDQYVDNDVFGTWADYGNLILWGFGVSLGRQAVVTLVAGWGIPISTS